MQISKILEAAQVQRGIIPQTFICACCGSELDRDDHMRGHFQPEFEETVFNAFGSNVCFGCADEFDKQDTEITPLPEYGSDDAFDIMKEERA